MQVNVNEVPPWEDKKCLCLVEKEYVQVLVLLPMEGK
jgi:hypothetical protein